MSALRLIQRLMRSHNGASAARVRGREGLALMTTLLVMVLMGAITAATMVTVLSSTRTANSDYREARTFYAAEAAGEAALAQLKLAVQDGVITDAEIAAITPPSLEGFDFSGFDIQRTGSAQVVTISDGPYAGLQAFTEDIDFYVPATDPSGSHSAITLSARAQSIPIYQFGVFYEEDLEIHPGPVMDFLGRIHGNSRVYLNANEARFHALISTPSTVISNYKHKFKDRDGVWIADNGGGFELLLFDSRMIPDADAFKARSCLDFDCRLQSEAFGVEPLNLPLPTGIPAHELIRPQEVGDDELEQQVKLAWLADMYVTVDLNDIKNQGAVCDDDDDDDDDAPKLPKITIERPLGGGVPNKPDKCKIFVWDWEAFVDSREKKPVDALNIDINELRNWVNDDPADNETRLIYVEIIPLAGAVVDPSKTDPTGDEYYPVVRPFNGSELPGPLTIATEAPLYIWGDYNTVNKQPAAVASDAYHVLSDAWDDSEHEILREADGAGLTDASPTTINVAILAGHSSTTCDINEDAGCTAPEYGGGFENYPRFLEDWNGVEYEYLGSIVSLWTAEIALGLWYRGSADYYKPPVRNWGFDLDLLDPANMPPGTPVVGSVMRTSFREAY